MKDVKISIIMPVYGVEKFVGKAIDASTGTTLANHKVTASINNETYYAISNSQGYFDIKIDSVYDGFLAVLNDKVTEKGYIYLSKVFDERYAEDGTTPLYDTIPD